MAWHETHCKNNVTQFMSCQNAQMKACLLEVHMTMIRNQIFAKNYVLLNVAQMVYVKVALGVQVEWS
jgi:hypothetical protein